MPFYVSPEQAMKDKADYARKAITRGRSGVVIECDAGILFVSPNPSRALHKFSELYDRIAFAAAGRYNEFERLRQAGVRYADLTGYQYDRQDVTARGLANWYAQVLGTIFTESNKPLEVEIVVAEVGESAGQDQIYRITFDGTVTDEHNFLVMGGQADQVAAVVRERYSDGMSLAGAMQVAVEALAGQGGNGQGNGAEPAEISGAQFEVAVLDRSRSHRTFRRLTGARLEALLAEARPAKGGKSGASGGAASSGASAGPGGNAGGAGKGGESGKGPGDSGKDGNSGKGSGSSGDKPSA
ncbi:MAG TPA: proteasome subunit alpha [Streptosporangiaceae bacterium]|nr:proteasome subunit alpha [Streptosporangiaceae bacterium]